MKRALCLLMICLFCTGCSALPPEERAFCVVLLIDGGAQECTVRVRIPTYQQNGGYQTLSATGATLTDALRTLESAAPMRLHWGLLRLIVLSRDGRRKFRLCGRSATCPAWRICACMLPSQ